MSDLTEAKVSKLSALETRLLAEVSQEKLWQNTQAIAQWEKISGTPAEKAAVAYMRQRLEEYGLATTVYNFESLLGWPEEAELELRAPLRKTIRAIAHSFSPSTAPEGIEGEVVYLGMGEEADFQRQPMAGQIVAMEGMPSPVRVLLAKKHGAAAVIFINDRLRDFCVSPVWGTPTAKTAGLLPNMPVISIARPDDEKLKSLLKQGPVKVWLRSKTFWGWRTVSILVGDIPGEIEPDKFVLFSGHHCSWYYGAMDNGAANATMLEVARVLSQHRKDLRRSVRIAFWPGHTQGRYSGSTWYFDHFWEDMHDNCVLHVNVDSTGARGADFYQAYCMPETSEYALSAIRDSIGHEAEPARQARAGDQSFWGCGVSSIFMSLSKVPIDQAANTGGTLFAAAGEGTVKKKFGSPWFWHTPDDTIDKIDPAVLRRDTLVYLISTLRAATVPILPLRFSATAEGIQKTLEGYQSAAGDRFDLAPVIERAKKVVAATAELDGLLDKAKQQAFSEKVADIGNRALMALGRIVVPTYFSSVDPFEQDLALPIPAVAALEPVRRLGKMDPTSDEFRFLATELTRNQNRVAFHFREAVTAAQEASAALRRVLS